MDKILPNNYVLKHKKNSGYYIIESVIGNGANTVVYNVKYIDVNGHENYHILKEYNPSYIKITRSDDGTIEIEDNDKERFEKGKKHFKIGCDRQFEIHNYEKTRNQTPPLIEYFEANNTIYLDVAKYTGDTLDKYKQNLSMKEIVQVCLAVAKSIKCYHDLGYLYLDIKPQNIFVFPQTKEIIQLIDFNSIWKKNEINFGNSLSYTKNWAAPEQVNPYYFSNISEATDIYSMGELIFWLIFQRHSTYDERLFCSTYSYDDEGLKFTSVLNRKKVKKILDNIFQHTIRPSIKNRFCNVDQLILNLEELQKELNIEEDLKDYTIRYNSFFVGREFELLQIEKSLNDNDIMFISGIAGIGKSELVKQYLRVHNKEYDHVLYWVFDGSFISMICNENSVTITNFSKQRNEKDISYCFRKLKKIKEILEGFNNLMVIDNVDKFIEEIPHQEIWEFLQGLPCKIIVTTRNREDLFNCITISSITEMKYLMQIFYQYCIFEKEQSIYVEQIINAVNHHTFLIELIAKQTYAMHLKPIEMLKTLRKLGINSLPENNIRTYKDGKLSSGSIIAHLEKIFTFSKIDDNYIILLALLSFIPVEGYNLEKLCLFFSIENRNIFNWIISRGWANLTNEINAKISIHPTIALVTIDYIKKKTALIEKIYQIFLNSIEKKDNGLSYEDYIMLSESIVMSTYKKYSINNKYSAIFLTKYVEEFYHYGNIDLKFDIIKCAINIFEKNISWKKYCAIQELAYFLEAQILWHLNQLDDSIRISKEHLRMSKINNDLYFSARWCILISCIYSSKENDKKPLSYSNRYYLKSAYYALKMDKDLNKNKPKFMNSDYLLNVLDYDYIEKDKNSFADNLLLNYANWMENYVEMSVLYSKKEKTDIEYLKHALRLRRKIKEDRLLRNTSNSFNIVIDEAKIEYLNKNYKESEEKLQRIVQFYEQNSIAETTILCRVHYLLCHIALRKKQNNYKQAIIELNECIRISEKIKDYGSLSAKLELGNLYNETGKLNLSKDLNTFLWRETRNMSQEIKETFYANALYNMGKLFLLEKKYFISRNMLHRSLEELDRAKASIEKINFDKARVYDCLGDWYSSNDYEPADNQFEVAKSHFEIAIYFFENSVGLNHPEAQRSLVKFNELKSTIQKEV